MKMKQSSEGLGKAIRVSRQRRAAYFLAGLMSTRTWPEKFGGDFPGPGDVDALSRMGLSLPKKGFFRWGASQSHVAFYDPENHTHGRVLDAALFCAEEMADIMRRHGIDQDEPLSADELVGIARLNCLEDGEFEPVGDLSPCFPKSVLDACLPEKELKALKDDILDFFERNLWEIGFSESKLEDIFPLEKFDEGLHVDEAGVFAWTHAAIVGSRFFTDITHDDGAASTVMERVYEIAEAARLVARKISLWLRAAIAVEPGFCLSSEETGGLLLGARVNSSHPTDGVPACVLNDDFIPMKEEFVKRLRAKAIELFGPVDAEIARAIERHKASNRKKHKAGMSM